MRKIGPLLLSLLLSGCGNYFTARVPYVLPDSPNAVAARQAMGGLYLVVKTKAPAEESAAGTLLGSLLNTPGPDDSPDALAARAARALTRPGMRVCAWRVDKSGADTDGFARQLAPSGVLEITASRPSLSSRKEERSSVSYDNKKRRETKTTVLVYSAAMTAGFRLLSWPAGTPLDSWNDTFTYSEDRYDKTKDAGDWYAENEEKLYGALTARLVARYSGRPVDRLRPVFRKKGDKQSEDAAALANRGDWAKADGIWLARAAAEGGWRDYLGLAVSAELNKDYAGAADYYRQAEKRSAGDKEAGILNWAGIYRDLEIAAATVPASDCAGTWFGVRTAVLPFTDETTSIDGPPLVRSLLYERLRESGYNLLPLEDTDEVLRRHGFSDGGQLAAAKPENIAAWLGAGRLVSVDLTDFGEIMAGVYNRRTVKGSVKVWDAATKEAVSFDESVVRVKTPKSFLGGMFGQLAKGLAERIKNKPLAYESGLFSTQAAGNLPGAVK